MFLNSELEEVSDVFELCKREFFKEIKRLGIEPSNTSLISATQNLNDGLDDIFDTKTEISNISALKKVYKKIMLKVHPDKLVLIEDEDLREMYSNVCMNTMKAMEDGSWYLLFKSAMDIGIKNIEIEKEHVEMLDNDCKNLEEKASNIKKSIPWIWFHSNENIKEKCLEQYSKIIK